MLKGIQLIEKLVELDGQPSEAVITQCGYGCDLEDGESYLLVDEFELALSRYGEGYVTAIAKLRSSLLKQVPSTIISQSLLLKRFTGSELLSRVDSLDSNFRPGPPWEKKNKIVIKCGYVSLTNTAEILVDYSTFNSAYIAAQAISHRPHSVDVSSQNSMTKPIGIGLGELATCIASNIPNGNLELKAIRVTYEGRGDDGAIDDLQYLFQAMMAVDDHVSEVETKLQLPEVIRFQGIELSRSEYEEIIKDQCFEIIGNAHGSCFNEEGSSGYLLIDVESSTIHGTHIQNAFQDGNYSEDEEVSQYYIR